MVHRTVDMDPDLWSELKVYAIKNQKTLKEIINESLRLMLQRGKKS